MKFGRSQLDVAKNWISLELPSDPDETSSLVRATLALKCPIDATSGKAVWGEYLGEEHADLVIFGSSDFNKARNASDACDLVSAQIVECLSSLGGQTISFFFLPVAQALERFQWEGAIQAFEAARQDGLIRFTGLACFGPPLATLIGWQYQDGFDALYVRDQEAYDMLSPLAHERRVGILTSFPIDDPHVCHLHRVGSLADLEGLMVAQ